ncbi:MAG: AAA family ATPase [Alphaproteobacteria bacterium]|nr:AAA family ATPase [Alphaproteobacteria bacterium]
MKPGQIAQDQGAVVAFLEDPVTHLGAAPERIDTHAAMVFLAGDLAYKLKRAVWFPFLDFSTLDRRRAACEAEVSLNRRTAPEIYLGCRPVTRQANGTLALDGDGEPIEWIVVMRRFNQDLLFDRMAERGDLTASHMTELADEIAAFHTAAQHRPDRGGSEALRWIIDDDIEELAAMPEAFGATGVEALRHLSDEALRQCATLLDARRAAGFVRHCHGDLHLRNILLWDGRPTLFDCLEFDETLACTDVLYDLAFLLMDLEHRGRRDFANLTFNRYLQRTGDRGGLPAVSLFLSCRAAIRAKVEASGAAYQHDETKAETMRAAAREYLKLATGFLTPHAPRLIAIGGESGCGKSTVASLAAPHLGEAPGALIIRSDVTRKHLFGCRLEEPLPPQAYGRGATERTYGEILDAAKDGLAAGMTVVADAVYADPAERAALEHLARDAKVPFHGIWLDVPLNARIERVAARRDDASDATAEFLRKHPRREKGVMRWSRIDASGTAGSVVAAVLDSLEATVAPA